VADEIGCQDFSHYFLRYKVKFDKNTFTIIQYYLLLHYTFQ